MFLAQAQRYRDQPRYRHRRDGTWQQVSWGARLDRVRAMAGRLVDLGVQPGELPYDFSIESGERTPSLKVKGKAIERKYRSVIEEMY
jgi:long-subunit acyl-CoA synthetase (AMP-forming)